MIANRDAQNIDARCERMFCLKCNREVLPVDTRMDSTFIIDEDNNLVRIVDEFHHRGCGGVIRPLLIKY